MRRYQWAEAQCRVAMLRRTVRHEGTFLIVRLDIIKDVMDPAELVRSTRRRLGLSQRQLALRAGMTQASISRIERSLVSPTFATIRELMHAMGEEPALAAQRLPVDWDPVHMTSSLSRTPQERLALAVSWNRMAARLAAAGEAARADG